MFNAYRRCMIIVSNKKLQSKKYNSEISFIRQQNSTALIDCFDDNKWLALD